MQREMQICELSKRFLGETVLMFVLEGFSGARSLGASEATELGVATKVVRSRDVSVCPKQTSDLLCMELPRGSVSIRATQGAGFNPSTPTTGRNDYAEIQFPRTLHGAREVLLIPDDRGQWWP